jgi:hypothetical protein
MGATEEQIALVAAAGLDHVAYILILYSFAFLMFLFVCMLIHLYDRVANPIDGLAPKDGGEDASGLANGHTRRGGGAEDRRVRDAEEFELEGLMSDDEDDGAARGRRRTSAGDDDGEAQAILGK